MKRKDVILSNEISELCVFTLNGYEQKVLIEGKRKDSPIIITLLFGNFFLICATNSSVICTNESMEKVSSIT